MKAIIKNELRLSRKLLVVWMGVVLLLCGFAYFEYLSLRDSLEDLAQLVGSFPKILTIMFGISEGVQSVFGWYGCIYYWVSFLTNGYAVYLGVSCIAKEDRQGTAEYLFTKPVSRGRIVTAKAIAGGCNLLILAAFSGLCNYFTAVLPLGGLEREGAVFTTTTGLFLTEITLFALSFFSSAMTRSYKRAVRWGAVLLIGFYGIYIAAGYTGISILNYLTPLRYFDVYAVAKGGLGFSFVLTAAAAIAISLEGAKKIWSEKEIRA